MMLLQPTFSIINKLYNNFSKVCEYILTVFKKGWIQPIERSGKLKKCTKFKRDSTKMYETCNFQQQILDKCHTKQKSII